MDSPILLRVYTFPTGAIWGQSLKRHLKSYGSAPSTTRVTFVSEGYSFFFKKPTAFLIASFFSLTEAFLPIHTQAPASPLSIMKESCNAQHILFLEASNFQNKMQTGDEYVDCMSNFKK